MSDKPALLKFLNDNLEQLWMFVFKSGAWIWYTLVGIIGKWSWNVMTGRKMTWRQVLASAGAALFVGFIAAKYCLAYRPDMLAYAVPVLVLASDKIVMAIMLLNWRNIIDSVINVYNGSKRK